MKGGRQTHRSRRGHRVGLAQPSAWRVAIYASVALWVAMAAGNVALYAVLPEGHWPLLESIETVQMASLIPIALLLDKVNGGCPASRVVTVVGIAAMLVTVAIDIGFITTLIAFGVGPVGGPLFVVGYLLVLAWLFAANALAWRAQTLPQGLARLGMATAITATLPYPAWGVWLAHQVREPAHAAH
jgi:hypothetical protein